MHFPMRLLSLLAMALLLGAASCTQSTETSRTTTKATPALTGAELFWEKAVREYLAANPGSDREANELFMQAIDQYRNQKDIPAALKLFTASLLQHPTAKAYYEYGNASMDAGKFEDAV